MHAPLLLHVLGGCLSQTIVFPAVPVPTTPPDSGAPASDSATPDDSGSPATDDSGAGETGTPPDTAPDAVALSAEPFAIYWGGARDLHLGRGLAIADLDGDGRPTVAVVGSTATRAPLRGTSVLFGIAEVAAGTHRVDPGDPHLTLRGVAAEGALRVSRLVDWDGPGDDALAVIAPGLRAAVRVYGGEPGAFGHARLAATYRLGGSDAAYYESATMVGDTDGDGVAELGLVARSWARTGPTSEVWTDTGNVSYTFSLPVQGGPVVTELQERDYAAEDDQGFDFLLPAGDTDGDGLSDILVGGTELSLVAGPLPDAGFGAGVDPVARWQVGQLWSGPAAWLGDVDGDGGDDLLVGRPAAEADDAGAAWVLHPSVSVPAVLDDAPSVLTGAPGDGLGTIVSAAGDFDGDGLPDGWVGSLGAGAWLVDGTGRTLLHVDPGTVGSGAVLVGGYDVTGDGAPDLVMVDPDADSPYGTGAGALWVWAGVR